MSFKVVPPASQAELLLRADSLAGMTLGQLAAAMQWQVPVSQLAAKGWVGQLLEVFLGANAACQPLPDFLELGIELKTLPIVQPQKPKETTYVCSIPLLTIQNETWLSSTVYKKLARVLWVPIEADDIVPLQDRRVGQAILWSPGEDDFDKLRADWELLTDLICLGRLAEINASLGTYLHIRPKAANSKALCWAIGETGEKIQTLPRGFYLRTAFTQQLVEKNYHLSSEWH